VREPLPPIDTPEQRAALRWSNREALADNLRWPEERLRECEQVSTDHPNWHVLWWADSSSGPEHYAARWVGHADVRASGATLAELLIDMAVQEDSLRVQQEREARPFRAIVAAER
jgi:hypothetical protein